MNQAWQEFLRAAGAHWQADRVLDFGDPVGERADARDGNVLVDLSSLALIRAQGPDAESFLNGQLSNDVRRVDRTHGQIAAWCNPKGRVLALLLAIRRDDVIYLLLPAALRDTILNRLRMFVLRAKLTLDTPATEFVTLGLSGPHSEKSLQAWLGEVPHAAYDCVTQRGVTVLRLPGIHPRFLLVVSAVDARDAWETLRAHARPAGTPCWDWLNIAAGMPQIYPETSEAFVPQMLNLELFAGVDFKKGCYPGQEIVARLHYRGGLKQRLYRTHAARPATPGDAVYAADLPGQVSGQVIESAAAPNGGYEMLVVLHISSTASGSPLRLGSETDGPLLELLPLPYSLGSRETG